MDKYFKILSGIILFLFILSNAATAEEILSWQECIKEAAKNHPDLIAAEEQVKQSEASKKITASALFPQINANLNASTARTATSNTATKTGDSYNYGATATQLLFDGIKTINNVRAASQNIEAAQQNFRFTSATVRFRLRSAFINLLRAQEMLRITQEIRVIRRSNLQLIALQYESGLEHKGALLTAEADLADANYGIIQAKRDLEVAQRDLIKEMGRTEFSPISASGDFRVKDKTREKPDFEAIAKNNPSLEQVIAQKKSAEFGVRAAYGNFSPTLNGQAGGSRAGTHWPAKQDQWNMGLALSMPIFEGGLRFAQVAQAKALLNQLKENERSTKDSIVLTLEQTWASLQDAMDYVEVQRKYLIANEERAKISQAEYSTGFILFDNWTIIQDNLVRSKKSFLDAQTAALLTEANWIQAKGETIEYE